MIGNGDLKWQRMMISLAPKQWIRSFVGILALPFRPLYNNMSLPSLLLFLRDSLLNVQGYQSYSQFYSCTVISCYKSSGSILIFFSNYSWRVPDRTAIFSPLYAASFTSCGQACIDFVSGAKCPISLSANIADICIPSQIVGDSDPKIPLAFVARVTDEALLAETT